MDNWEEKFKKACKEYKFEFINERPNYQKIKDFIAHVVLYERKQAQLEILDKVLTKQCEMYNAYRYQVVKVSDIEEFREELK